MNSSLFQIIFPALTPKENATDGTDTCDDHRASYSGCQLKNSRKTGTMRQPELFELPIPPGFEIIFRPWKTDPKTGRRIYPRKARVFKMLVKTSRR